MNSQDREFLVRFICESDRIEQIEDDPDLLRKQLRNKNKRGHVGAFNYLIACIERRETLNEDMIKHLQNLIVSEQHKKGARKLKKKDRGNWRNRDVWVGGRICEDPKSVPLRMEAHVANIMEWQKTYASYSFVENVSIIAHFHVEFLQIHPFIDGNGRTSRAIAYYLYRFAGLPPFIFTAHDRHATYYPCFTDAFPQKAMEEYFLSRTTFPVL